MEIPTTIPQRPTLHKRRQVADTLRAMVAGLQAGDRLPSVTDLEKHFGVAKSTVEAAVGDLQAEGLIVRRHGSGTFVAERVASTRHGVGRMVITSVGLGSAINIFSALAEALAVEMRRLGYDPILLSESTPQRRLAQAQARWEAHASDGYVYIGSLENDVTFPAAPGVVIGEMPEDAAAFQAVVDNYDGGGRAGEYLWSLGHRNVAFVAMHDLLPALRRFQGLEDSLRERGGDGVTVTETRVVWQGAAGSDIPNLETALRALLDRPEPPTAIFFGNDQVAFSGLQILLAWGVHVPQDMSVVSFDDTPGLASHTRPALTCLRMPITSLAAVAVQMLHQAVLTPGLPFQRLLLPAEVIIRESSGPAPHLSQQE